MSEKKFRKIESSSTWAHKNEGDTLEGVLISRIPAYKENKVSARYYIENPDGKYMVWGAADLDDKMAQVKIGDYVRLTYHGKKDIGKGKTLHKFTVEVDDEVADGNAETKEEQKQKPAPTPQPSETKDTTNAPNTPADNKTDTNTDNTEPETKDADKE